MTDKNIQFIVLMLNQNYVYDVSLATHFDTFVP
jgi:hypothetical protein